MNRRLVGRIAVVTGGAACFGRSATCKLVGDGVDVAVADFGALEEVKALAEGEGGELDVPQTTTRYLQVKIRKPNIKRHQGPDDDANHLPRLRRSSLRH